MVKIPSFWTKHIKVKTPVKVSSKTCWTASTSFQRGDPTPACDWVINDVYIRCQISLGNRVAENISGSGPDPYS